MRHCGGERESELWSQNWVPIPALPFPPSENDKWLTPQPQIPGSRTALALRRHSMNHSHFPLFNKYSLNKFTCLVSPCAISSAFPHKYNMKVLLIPIYQSNESEPHSMMTNKLGLKGLKVVQLLQCYLGDSFQLTRDLWTLMGRGRHPRRLLTFRKASPTCCWVCLLRKWAEKLDRQVMYYRIEHLKST